MNTTAILSQTPETQLNIITEAFMLNGNLFNASYIPSEETVTVMLEKVVRYPREQIYYKNKINTLCIKVLSPVHISLSSMTQKLPCSNMETALAAATAVHKLGLTDARLTVDMDNGSLEVYI